MATTDLPPQQHLILDRCFHPSGTFVEFMPDEVEQPVSTRFENQTRLYPNRLAVKTTRQEISYCELNRDANRVAHAILNQTGIEDHPVVLLFEQGIQAVIGMLGVLKSGRAFVPLDPAFPLSRTSFMVEDVGSKLILTDNRNLALARELASNGCLVIDVEALDPSLSAENPDLPISPGDLAYVLYTSGSTGQPKGVAHSQRNLLHASMNHTNIYHISACDRLTMLYTPLASSGLRDIFRATLNGATLYPFDVRADGIGGLPHWMTQNQITICHTVPTVYRLLMSNLGDESGLPDLRLLVLSGETVFKTDVAQFLQKLSQNCVLINVLGSTEMSNFRWYLIDHKTQIQGNSVPVGYEISKGIDLLLLDDNLSDVGFNNIGQIAIKSRYLPLGYWNRPDLTQAAYLDDPDGGDLRTFLTGDLGRLGEDGCLEHLGRMDFQVKVRGSRVELSEIENALIGLGAIKEAAVIADSYNSSDNQKLIAYYVLSDQASPTPSDLLQLLRKELPDYMVPSTFIPMDSIPKLPGGKLDRRSLPKPALGRPDVETPFVSPRSVVEQMLADIWAQVLQVDQVGRHDDFLDLGGDSLMAAALLVQVEEKFQKKLPLAALIQASTVAEMAKILRNERWKSSESCLVPIQPKGNKPPFFCIHGRGGHVLGFAALARHLGEDQPFYGLESAGRDGEQEPLTDIEAMATRYINDIRTVQPDGPYLLGGFSMGGAIAFEMAQQLRADGQEVGLLALFDTECHGPTGAWRRHIEMAIREVRNSPKLLRFNHITKRRILREKFEIIARSAIAYSVVDKPNRQAIGRYRPSSYAGKVTFFWASDSAEGPSDLRFGWRELASKGMDIHRVPGDHHSILMEPQLQVLAERLKDCLNQASPTS